MGSLPFVGGRLAVVIGSECDALGALGFPASRATQLHQALIGSGVWQPADPAGGGLVLDPDLPGLEVTISSAFAAAAAVRATLLIAFVGHGVTTGLEDFYLLAKDSPATLPAPRWRHAYQLVQGIRDQLDTHPHLDGLVVLIDACQAGQAAAGAARRWDVLNGQARMELLVASTAGDAFNGCFTHTLVRTLAQGIPVAGEYLRCTDLQPALTRCPGQDSAHLAFTTGSSLTDASDPGLWLLPNPARKDDAVQGRPSAGLVDQLTRGVVLTDTLRETLANIIDGGGHRLRLITGPPGAGKSTLISLLIRPTLADLDVTARHVDAAVFLDQASTLPTVTGELADQLTHRVPGFPQALAQVDVELTDQDRAGLDSFDTTITLPLTRCHRPGRRITLLVDGYDQPDLAVRNLLAGKIRRLTEPQALQHVRVILTVRTGTMSDQQLADLGPTHRITLPPPSTTELATTLQDTLGPAGTHALTQLMVSTQADGGWLITRLLTETTRTSAFPTTLDQLVDSRIEHALATGGQDPDTTRNILRLLVAAGTGPILPLTLLTHALHHLGTPATTSQIRDILVNLGALVSRGNPGQPHEHTGIAHTTLLDTLTHQPDLTHQTEVHRALAQALAYAADQGYQIA